MILGLSVRSSWGNGHATTYRSLIRALAQRGHRIIFLERDTPWYAQNCDISTPFEADVHLYSDFQDLRARFASLVREADLVMVGSYTPDGVAVGRWAIETAGGATAFYDIDTPITLEKLDRNDTEYLSREVIKDYDLYLSFTGGPTLDRLSAYGAKATRVLYCSADPDSYYAEQRAVRWDLGYMGTYSQDRSLALDHLLLVPARRWKHGRMVVAGPMYPDTAWPSNVTRIEHAAPRDHRAFYGSLRFTLNLTRQAMKSAGYSPSVRLFEAAACGCAIISDYWNGLEEFFLPGEEILLARTSDEMLGYLKQLSDSARKSIGKRAREKILAEHSGAVRARQLERYIAEVGA